MIGRLNHVAIAVRDIAKAAEIYRKALGATVSAVVPQPAHGVNTVFITLPKPRRRDPDSVGDAVRKGVRAAVAQHWRKKPNVTVHVLIV